MSRLLSGVVGYASLTHPAGCANKLGCDLSGLREPIGEAIGLALDRGIEHLDRVRIVLVREHGAFLGQYEAGRLHLLASECRLNPMQRLGVARARPDGGGVVYDDVGPTGLQ